MKESCDHRLHQLRLRDSRRAATGFRANAKKFSVSTSQWAAHYNIWPDIMSSRPCVTSTLKESGLWKRQTAEDIIMITVGDGKSWTSSQTTFVSRLTNCCTKRTSVPLNNTRLPLISLTPLCTSIFYLHWASIVINGLIKQHTLGTYPCWWSPHDPHMPVLLPRIFRLGPIWSPCFSPAVFTPFVSPENGGKSIT